MRKTITLLVMLFMLQVGYNTTFAQESNLKGKIEQLKEQKDKIAKQEKKALKEEVKAINARLDKGEITEEEAQELKEAAAKVRALNIENRLAIIDNQIALLERNGPNTYRDEPFENDSILMAIFEEDREFFGVRIGKKSELPKKIKKTTSNLVLGLGLHNNDIKGQEFFDTPHSILGSRYFEFGIMWKTRIFRNSNWLRLNYGAIYESKGLKSNNELFVKVDSDKLFKDIVLKRAEEVYNDENVSLKKSKVRMDGFIFPVYLEFGPSSKKKYGEYVRYSTYRKFKFGIGAYFGVHVRNIQKVRFENFPSTNFGYLEGTPIGQSSENYSMGSYGGWSIYAGVGNTTLVFKYEAEPNYLRNPESPRHNVSLGVRLEL